MYRLDDLSSLNQHIQKIFPQIDTLNKILQDKQGTLFNQYCPRLNWSVLYELSFKENLILCLYVVGILPTIMNNIHSNNNLSNLLKIIEPTHAIPDPTFKTEGEKRLFFSCVLSLLKNIQSLSICGKSLNTLVAEAIDGNILSYYTALEIDHTCITTPSLASVISRAELLDDQELLNKIRHSLKNRLGNRWVSYKPLRLMLILLKELQILDGMNKQSRHDLIVDTLKLYQATNDSPENLQKLIYRWEKESRTTIDETLSSPIEARFHYVLSHVFNEPRSRETWHWNDTYYLLWDLLQILSPEKITWKRRILGLLLTLQKKQPPVRR